MFDIHIYIIEVLYNVLLCPPPPYFNWSHRKKEQYVVNWRWGCTMPFNFCTEQLITHVSYKRYSSVVGLPNLYFVIG